MGRNYVRCLAIAIFMRLGGARRWGGGGGFEVIIWRGHHMIVYLSWQRVKWKHFKYKFTLNNNFIMIMFEIYVKFRIFSVIRNDFGNDFAGWWLYSSKWPNVRPICRNIFQLTHFYSCWKLFGSLTASWVIYDEDALLMIYWSIPFWDILPQVENLKSL